MIYGTLPVRESRDAAGLQISAGGLPSKATASAKRLVGKSVSHPAPNWERNLAESMRRLWRKSRSAFPHIRQNFS
jgi:hypothetical protein